MSAQEKRKKSRLRIRDKYTQIANLKKLNDRRATDSRGRKKKLKQVEQTFLLKVKEN